MSLQPGRLKTQKAPIEDSEKGPTCAYSNATDEGLPMGPPKYIAHVHMQIFIAHVQISSRTCKLSKVVKLVNKL